VSVVSYTLLLTMESSVKTGNRETFYTLVQCRYTQYTTVGNTPWKLFLSICGQTIHMTVHIFHGFGVITIRSGAPCEKNLILYCFITYWCLCILSFAFCKINKFKDWWSSWRKIIISRGKEIHITFFICTIWPRGTLIQTHRLSSSLSFYQSSMSETLASTI
jgi:hypothetical protein